MIEINSKYFDREVALLIYKGRLYEDVNHQYALEQALRDENKVLSENIDSEIDRLADITHQMSQDNEIGTFDLYVGDYTYVVAHTKENLINNLSIIKTYAENEDAFIGYFADFNSYEFVVLQDMQDFEEIEILHRQSVN